jgi:peptidoglycan/LPS O-acetylase OafA/YrhL
MAFHIGYHVPRGGFLGVDVFFVLSGFLITTLLIREHDRGGTIAFRAFYMRRALRLFPAIVVVVVFTLVAVKVFSTGNEVHITVWHLPLVALYVGNWARALDFNNALGWLGQTWSLAIEEQFYLLGPGLIFLLIRKLPVRRWSGSILFGAALLDMGYRFAMLEKGWSIDRLFYGMDTHCDGLLVGCALAFWMSDGLVARTSRRRVVATGAAIAVIIGLSVTVPIGSIAISAGIPIVEIATAIAVWQLVTVEGTGVHRVLESRTLVWIGQRSYGLYLWHFPIYQIVITSLSPPEPFLLLVAMPLSFCAAALSYRWVETPFLSRKVRFRPEGPPERSVLLLAPER